MGSHAIMTGKNCFHFAKYFLFSAFKSKGDFSFLAREARALRLLFFFFFLW